MNFTELIKGKKGKEKIIMLTAYDCQIARILDEASVDLILVGDSVGMVFQGKANTKSVRMVILYKRIKPPTPRGFNQI